MSSCSRRTQATCAAEQRHVTATFMPHLWESQHVSCTQRHQPSQKALFWLSVTCPSCGCYYMPIMIKQAAPTFACCACSSSCVSSCMRVLSSCIWPCS